MRVTLEVKAVTKSFGTRRAVDALSFTVEAGQVFGLLGLNGAGKSTTIRMILDILEPDAGEILWQGRPTRERQTGRFGYLPEERGLYPQMKVLPQLVLFGRLQGLERAAAAHAAKRWLERFDIVQYAGRTVSELSKGNQQKVQFIAAALHNPDIMILDEPFSGLDPVNTSLFKDVFRELVASGKTILFSSHRLDHVEELSDRIAIIHQARIVLEGGVRDILGAQPPQFVRIGADEAAVRPHLPVGCPVEVHHGMLSIPVSACDSAALLRELVSQGIAVTHYELVRPSLNDVFLEKVGKSA